jgi:nucleotide-binding universal stress UspA family protein
VAGVVHGSVSVTLASHASVPVVIVRGNPGEGSPRVVVGANGQEDAAGALELGFAEAAARGVPLTILTCVDDGAVDRSALEQQAGTLALKYEGVETDLAVAHGSAAEALVEASRSADLVVVGARRRHSRAAALLGSVGLAVVQRSSCTVAVVRPPGRAAR